jgi:prevent-host-death family protein
MRQITTAEARKHLAELLNRAAYGKERFVVTRHGKELVAIVPLEEVTLLDRLRSLLSRKDFEAALAEMRDSGTRDWDDVRKELDLG